MRKSLEAQVSEMEEKKKALEAEISAWEATNGVSLEELRRRSLEREWVTLSCFNLVEVLVVLMIWTSEGSVLEISYWK